MTADMSPHFLVSLDEWVSSLYFYLLNAMSTRSTSRNQLRFAEYYPVPLARDIVRVHSYVFLEQR
jgi:hypothetical protein